MYVSLVESRSGNNSSSYPAAFNVGLTRDRVKYFYCLLSTSTDMCLGLNFSKDYIKQPKTKPRAFLSSGKKMHPTAGRQSCPLTLPYCSLGHSYLESRDLKLTCHHYFSMTTPQFQWLYLFFLEYIILSNPKQ